MRDTAVLRCAAAQLAMLLSLSLGPVESKVGDLAPYIPPKPQGVFRCFAVTAQVCALL